MVDIASATGGRLANSPSTIQIDEDHSNLVKFSLGDHRIPIMIDKLDKIGGFHENLQEQVASDDFQEPVTFDINDDFTETAIDEQSPLDVVELPPPTTGIFTWDYDREFVDRNLIYLPAATTGAYY